MLDNAIIILINCHSLGSNSGSYCSWIAREDFYLSIFPENCKVRYLSQQPKRPLTTLQRAINRKVSVRLKNEYEYRGKMSNVDSYMNLILVDAEEFNGATHLANYGKVVIRGNNVLFIKLENEL